MAPPKPWWIPLACLIAVALPTGMARGTDFPLPAGGSVKVLAAGQIQLKNGERGVALRYQTATPVDRYLPARMESDQIWERFFLEAEKLKVPVALLRAQNAPGGPDGKAVKAYNFVYQKSGGFWRTYEPRNQRLDRKFVADFMQRLTGLLRTRNIRSLSLYLAAGWQMKLTTGTGQNAPEKTVSRTEYLRKSVEMLAACATYRLTDAIREIRIIDSVHAAVDHASSENVTCGRSAIAVTSHATDSFELKQGIMTWTNSDLVIETQKQLPTNARP